MFIQKVNCQWLFDLLTGQLITWHFGFKKFDKFRPCHCPLHLPKLITGMLNYPSKSAAAGWNDIIKHRASGRGRRNSLSGLGKHSAYTSVRKTSSTEKTQRLLWLLGLMQNSQNLEAYVKATANKTQSLR